MIALVSYLSLLYRAYWLLWSTYKQYCSSNYFECIRNVSWYAWFDLVVATCIISTFTIYDARPELQNITNDLLKAVFTAIHAKILGKNLAFVILMENLRILGYFYFRSRGTIHGYQRICRYFHSTGFDRIKPFLRYDRLLLAMATPHLFWNHEEPEEGQGRIDEMLDPHIFLNEQQMQDVARGLQEAARRQAGNNAMNAPGNQQGNAQPQNVDPDFGEPQEEPGFN